MNQPILTVIIPQYKENEKILQRAVEKIHTFLDKRKITYEIIICQNGFKKRKPLKIENVTVLFTTKKGLGCAIKKALGSSKGTFFYFSPADIPFSFTDLKKMLEIRKKYDFILGSKLHEKSIYKINRTRKIISYLQSGLTTLLLPSFHIKDANGTYFGNIKSIKKYIESVKSNDFFFGVELTRTLLKHDMKLIEVPVIYIKNNNTTSVNMIRDGVLFIAQLIKLSFHTK